MKKCSKKAGSFFFFLVSRSGQFFSAGQNSNFLLYHPTSRVISNFHFHFFGDKY